MARPLREQFALATLLLLIPVAGVMTWAAGTTYSDQVAQLDQEATRLASAIAAHIQETEHRDRRVAQGLSQPAQVCRRRRGHDHRRARAEQWPAWKPSNREVEEHATRGVPIPGLGWDVSVGIPTSVAWWRAGPIYQRTIGITAIATLIMLVLEVVFVRRWLRRSRSSSGPPIASAPATCSPPPLEPMPSRELEHLRDAFSGHGREPARGARVDRAAGRGGAAHARRSSSRCSSRSFDRSGSRRSACCSPGIAHELNNPLQAISGFAELLQREPDLRADVRADLALIKKESARASAIIRNLSRFSRQQGSNAGAVYLRDVVASVVELRQRRFQEQGITLDVDEQASQPTLAVFTELQQVLLNFVINAEQAIGSGTSPDRRIAIRTSTRIAASCSRSRTAGPACRREDESKLFQPFFTTKPIGEGTGLGLSVSYGIIRSFGGTIGYRRGDLGGALVLLRAAGDRGGDAQDPRTTDQ